MLKTMRRNSWILSLDPDLKPKVIEDSKISRPHFLENLFSSFCADKPTNQQIDKDKNVTLLAEVDRNMQMNPKLLPTIYQNL